MRRSLRHLGVAALMIAVTGCSLSPQAEPRVVGPDAVPFRLLDRDAPPLVPRPSGGQTETARVCFLSDGKLLPVGRSLPAPVTPTAAVAALAAPPAPLRTAIGDPGTIRAIEVIAGIAHVDLDGRVSTVSSEEQLLAVAQIVCTLTTRPGIGQVVFTLDSAPVDVPRADGSLASSTVSRDDYEALLAR